MSEHTPSILRKLKFSDEGFVEHTDSFDNSKRLLVPAYVASQLGFSNIGMDTLHGFYSRLFDVGIQPLCPFTACGEFINTAKLDALNKLDEIVSFWNEFNNLVGEINYGQLMPKSKLMIAILDGGHAVDDGVAAEIGFYAAEYKGEKPIIGIRSDFRLAENVSAPVNPAVRYFIDKGKYHGFFFDGKTAYGDAIKRLEHIAKQMTDGRSVAERPTKQNWL